MILYNTQYLVCFSAKKTVQQSEVNFFLSDNKEEYSLERTPASEWLTSQTWAQICKIQTLQQFSGL